MDELISHSGLQLYIFRLSGTLRYTLTVTGKPPRNFELHDVDFEDAEGCVKEKESLTLHGTGAGAVGLNFSLIKNIGTLETKFEGRNGGSAAWTFKGLEGLSRDGQMYATAGVQTSGVGMMDSSMQTMVTNHTNSSLQTEFVQLVEHNTQTDIDAKIDVSSKMVDASTVTHISIPSKSQVRSDYKDHILYDPKRGIKRAMSSMLEVHPNKKQRFLDGFLPPKVSNYANPKKLPNSSNASTLSKKTSNKRYLFLRGYKREPRLSPNYSTLRIDTVNMEARWQECSGDYPWKWEVWECNINLRESKLKVQLVHPLEEKLYKGCNNQLQITYPSGLKIHKRLSVHFLDSPYMYESNDPDSKDKTKILRGKRIIRALKGCIEHQSNMPLEFWHSGGAVIAMEPGSVVGANR